MGNTVNFPFSAIVESEAAKRALLLLAVDAGLRGVLIGAAPGSAKSALARSFESISRDFNPLMHVPAGIAAENLIGGLDIESTLGAGKPVISPGLLARADGRVIYIADINAMDLPTLALIASVIDSGGVRIEREAASEFYPSIFRLIGGYNPAEGLPRSPLINRLGLIVEQSPIESTADRTEIISRSFHFKKNPFKFAQEHADQDRRSGELVARARALLPRVKTTRKQLKRLVGVAASLSVEGCLTDLFAARAARANAALAGRTRVEEEDLILAIQLVLMPRAGRLPEPAQHARQDETVAEDNRSDNIRAESSDEYSPGAGSVATIEDLIIKAIDSTAPELFFERMRKSGLRKSGRRGNQIYSDRGRAIKGDGKRGRISQTDLFKTLCAAAPFQAARREQAGPIKIKKTDIKYKRFKSRSGILFIFAVDASGSMALNRMAQAKGALARVLQKAYLYRDEVALISFRGQKADLLLPPTRSIERAKSLIDNLPAGGGTPVAAALLRAIEIARYASARKKSQALLVLMTDGRANVALSTPDQNGPIDHALINEELRSIGRVIRREAIESVVIDTKSRFVSTGEASKLAEILGGRYLYLLRSGPAGIHNAIETVAAGLRKKSFIG